MISVCIATHNGGKYIKEQIDSIIIQLGRDDEIVVSDDGSTDDTISILNSYNDDRIRVLHYQHTAHYKHAADYTAHNFENALQKARGDLIFLSDQDDVWLPDKIRIMTKALEDNYMVISDCIIVDADLNMIYNSYFKIHRTKKGIINNLYINAFHGACMAFRKEILSYALPFPVSDVGHDFWLGLIASYYYNVDFINTPLIYYRRHNETVSPSAQKSSLPIKYRIKYRLITIYEFVRRVLS